MYNIYIFSMYNIGIGTMFLDEKENDNFRFGFFYVFVGGLWLCRFQICNRW